MKKKVDRGMELQEKKIQIEENYLQKESCDSHVRANRPSALCNTQVYIWEGQLLGWGRGDHGASLKLPLPYNACSNPPFNQGKHPGK